MEDKPANSETVSTGSKWLLRSLILLCLLSLLAVILFSYKHQTFKNKIYETSKADLKELTVKATIQIESILQQAMSAANALADDLTTNRVNRQNMLQKLQAMLASNENFYGGTITFVPYGYDPKVRLYSAYYSKSGPDGALEFSQIADIYDYTTPEYDWYVEPMTKGNRWGEPYWDEAGKTYMTTYSALFYWVDPQTKQKSPLGVVTLDISMAQIKKIIQSLDIGPSGFGALTTRDGNYLYHPNSEYVQQHLNIRDVAQKKNDPDRLLIAEKAASGEGGIIDHVSTTTGEESWLIFETVPISGWSLQNTFIKSDLNIDVDKLRQQIIWIVVAAIIFVSTFISIVLRVNLGSPVRVWIITAVVSVLFVVGIGIIWDLALTYHSSTRLAGVKVSDNATLQAVMNGYQLSSEKKHLNPPLFVPTGVFIDAIVFNNANDISVTGRIWQKYPADSPASLTKGFQIGRSKSVKIEKINSVKENGTEVIQWSFQAELREPVDYSRYPLEVEHIGMQILPVAADHNIILVPDLSAYRLTTAALLPGLGEDVFLPGWKLSETFFLLRKMQQNTNFGVEQNFDRDVLPTLYYEIGIKRVFVDAFISNLTPLIIVAIVLFALVLLSKNIEVGRILSICVAVFFVVVFSHLDIRKNISAGEIFYLEYFFFVIYFTIILVPMDSFRLALNIHSRFFEYQNGLFGKAIYWPSILGVFFVITVVKFY